MQRDHGHGHGSQILIINVTLWDEHLYQVALDIVQNLVTLFRIWLHSIESGYIVQNLVTFYRIHIALGSALYALQPGELTVVLGHSSHLVRNFYGVCQRTRRVR